MKRKRIETDGGESLQQSPFAGLDKFSFAPQNDKEEVPVVPAGKRPEKPANRGRIEIRREKAGRGGKRVTTATGFTGACPAEQREWVRELKQRCGGGGTVRAGVIEIQGDHREELMEFFSDLGFRPVLAGG